MGTISIQVLFLGPARDFARSESDHVDLEGGSTVAELRALLAQRYPKLAPALSTARLAVNEEFVRDDRVLLPGDVAAVIPPVSGGEESTTVWIDLVNSAIPTGQLREFVGGDTRLGGIVTFEGATRSVDDPQHGRLVRLEYEAYDSMARRQLEHLAEVAVKRWGPGRIAILHRLGPVPPGETSVALATAFAHRKEAYEASRWLIDTLKVDVAIWKKDIFEDGFVRWVEKQSRTPRRIEAGSPHLRSRA